MWVKCRSTNTQVELSDDRMWLEVKLWELPHNVLSDYLCVSHIHTQATAKQRIYCHSDTLNALSERMALFFNRVEKWRIESAGRGKREGRHTKTCKTPSGQIWHCVIQSCAPHPTWSLLNTLTHSPTHKKHCINWHSNTSSIYATKPKIFFSLNVYHFVGRV